MSAAHKNECPGGAGQVVQTISKRAADFMGTCARLTSAVGTFPLASAAVALQAILMRLEVLK